jgi:putative membrane protein
MAGNFASSSALHVAHHCSLKQTLGTSVSLAGFRSVGNPFSGGSSMNRILNVMTLAAGLCLHAQILEAADAGPNPATATPGAPSEEQLNTSDRIFILAASMGGTAEVEFGKLAAERGRSDPVKKFAARTVDDHSKANDELASLASKHEIALPKTLDVKHKKIREKLEGADGPAFDLAYIDSQVTDHQQAVQLFRYEIGSGQNEQLKGFAAKTLPTLMHHLKMVQELKAELVGLHVSKSH